MERSSSDGLSRILAVVSVLFAVGLAVVFFLENRQLRSRLDTLESAPAATELATKVEQLTASDQAFKNKWDTQLGGALQKFEERADQLAGKLQDSQTQVDQLQDRADQVFQEQRDAVAREVAKLSSTGPQEADVRAIVQAEFQALQLDAVDKPAPLRVAQNLMKAATNDEAHVAVIQNDAQRDVAVDYVSFRPRVGGQFPFDGEPLASDNPLADWRIRFVPTENTATEPGEHDDYERRFTLPRSVPAQEATRIVLEIENSRHRGWGLEGVLVIGYEDGKELEVPGARAIFVETPDAT